MIGQATLPFFPHFAPEAPEIDAGGANSEVSYIPLPAREILNRAVNPRLPFAWTINPYRGCELGCTYCYARYTHGFLELDRWEDFEQRIFVKEGAAAALRRSLRRRDLRGQPIAIGTATDPYQPAEQRFGVTRELLTAFLDAEGLDLSLTTKSPLVLRDLELLTALDRRHALTLNITITTLDRALARRLEPHAPEPRARLAAVERLAEAGLAVAIFCKPVLPGINDGEETLRPLFAAAARAGACDVVASPLFLQRATRARFMPWLASEFPAVAGLYRRLFAERDRLSPAAVDQLLVDFRRLRLAYGFPRSLPGRG